MERGITGDEDAQQVGGMPRVPRTQADLQIGARDIGEGRDADRLSIGRWGSVAYLQWRRTTNRLAQRAEAYWMRSSGTGTSRRTSPWSVIDKLASASQGRHLSVPVRWRDAVAKRTETSVSLPVELAVLPEPVGEPLEKCGADWRRPSGYWRCVRRAGHRGRHRMRHAR